MNTLFEKNYAMELRRIGRNILISSTVSFHEAKSNLHLKFKEIP